MRKGIGFCGALIMVMLLMACGGAQQTPAAAPAGTKSAPAKPESAAGGWQTKWEQTLAEAKKEGRVTVYGEAGPAVRTEVSGAFKKKFGIDLEFLSGASLEVAQKYIVERNANLFLADGMMMGGPTMLLQVKPKGFLTSIEPQLILPEVKDPGAWAEGKVPFLDQDKMVLPLTQGYYSYIFVNTDLVKDGDIKSLFDLLDPRWKSQITMIDPTVTGSSSKWISFILIKMLGPEKGQEYLRSLAKLEPMITKDKRLHVEWVARGKYAIGIGPNMQSLAEFITAGAPIKSIRIKEGGGLSPSSSCIALPNNGPHPNATIVLVNWLLTAEGQTVFSQAFGQPAVRNGIPIGGMIDPFTVMIPGETAYWADEQFTLEEEKGMLVAKQIFGPLMK